MKKAQATTRCILPTRSGERYAALLRTKRAMERDGFTVGPYADAEGLRRDDRAALNGPTFTRKAA